MAGLPPIVLHSAGDDPLCIDADKIEKAAAEAGTGIVEHRRFDDLWHDFHLQVSVLAEADEAINDLGARLRTPHDRNSSDTNDAEMSSFEGKVAVITGAGSGIGRALALNLAARGRSWRSPTSTPRVWPRRCARPRRSGRR